MRPLNRCARVGQLWIASQQYDLHKCGVDDETFGVLMGLLAGLFDRILDRAIDSAERKTQNRINQRIDQTIDKGLNKTEETMHCVATDQECFKRAKGKG